MTKGQRDRAYAVLAHALIEEARVMKLTPAELSRRQREIIEECYGDTRPSKEVNE